MLTTTPHDLATFDPEVMLQVLSQVKAGDFTARMPLHWVGVEGKIADGLNEIISANEALGAKSVTLTL